MNLYDFYSGREFYAYKELGAHVLPEGTEFTTYAPGAAGITVTGEFNNWEETPMERCYDGGFFKCYIEGARPGMMYKYKIYHKDGSMTEHADPYGYGMELRPAWCSIIRDLSAYKFNDEKWMRSRSTGQGSAINIYEMHLGSWRTKPVKDKDGNIMTPDEVIAADRVSEGWYTYKEIAPVLVEYLKENGYNYVEFMPLAEHPSDESWGYQDTGFFSPTSRYGSAEELMYLIDMLHQNNIGAILDFVPVHFAVDSYGLACYDGTSLYEHPSSDVSYSEWGTCNFLHSRGEVRSFLQSAANYWLSEYHFDGLRMDAISRIVYWMGDEKRGVNDRAVEFVAGMNGGLKELHPSIMLFAEDSTNFPGITKEVKYGGLGFDYKWDMGWMNDTLDFFKIFPWERGNHYHKLTFAMMYYYNERYMCPLAHDEVVHGKATIIQKMSGEYEGKFAQVRALYMYMMAKPGKKLNFMGNEFAQFREWDEKRQQDWDLLKYPKHDAFHRFMKELNKLYLEEACLSAWDDDPRGFDWILCGRENEVVYIFQRKYDKLISTNPDSYLEEKVIVVMNLSGNNYEEYHMRYGEGSSMDILIHSDWNRFGGETHDDVTKISGENGEFVFALPAQSAIYLRP